MSTEKWAKNLYCAEGRTRVNQNNKCDVNEDLFVARDKASTFCGNGTFFQNQKCVPNIREFCAGGTKYDATREMCVADFSKACSVGTVYNQTENACVPAPPPSPTPP